MGSIFLQESSWDALPSPFLSYFDHILSLKLAASFLRWCYLWATEHYVVYYLKLGIKQKQTFICKAITAHLCSMQHCSWKWLKPLNKHERQRLHICHITLKNCFTINCHGFFFFFFPPELALWIFFNCNPENWKSPGQNGLYWKF